LEQTDFRMLRWRASGRWRSDKGGGVLKEPSRARRKSIDRRCAPPVYQKRGTEADTEAETGIEREIQTLESKPHSERRTNTHDVLAFAGAG
jgi:hypothetical protein